MRQARPISNGGMPRHAPHPSPLPQTTPEVSQGSQAGGVDSSTAERNGPRSESTEFTSHRLTRSLKMGGDSGSHGETRAAKIMQERSSGDSGEMGDLRDMPSGAESLPSSRMRPPNRQCTRRAAKAGLISVILRWHPLESITCSSRLARAQSDCSSQGEARLGAGFRGGSSRHRALPHGRARDSDRAGQMALIATSALALGVTDSATFCFRYRPHPGVCSSAFATHCGAVAMLMST